MVKLLQDSVEREVYIRHKKHTDHLWLCARVQVPHGISLAHFKIQMLTAKNFSQKCSKKN
jgi:hypothetical protein